MNLTFARKIIHKTGRLSHHAIEDLYRLFLYKLTPSPKIINNKEIRIIGLRRSGNHALVEWIKAQEKGVIEHLNNVVPRQNPYRYKYENIIDFHPEHSNWAYKHYLPFVKGNFIDLDCLICGYEDFKIDLFCDFFYEQFHDIYVGKSHKRIDVLILRDPFNLFASRIKSNMVSTKCQNLNSVGLFIQYAKEFLNETTYLTNNKVCINYNRWVIDNNYRKDIANSLDIEFTDQGIDKVVSLGGGSSFEGQEMDGKARQMKVLDRWQYFIDDDDFREIFKNPILLDYSKRIFGEIPGTQMLI